MAADPPVAAAAPLMHVPNPNAPAPLPAQAAVKRPLQHRMPQGKREPFLPADHVHAKRHLHVKS